MGTHIQDLKGLLIAVFELCIKKVDPLYVISWNNHKTINIAKFASRAYSVLKANKYALKENHKRIQDILRRNSILFEAVYIAQDVYHSNSGKLLSGGWKRSNAFADLTYVDKETGLISALYERTQNGKTEYVYAAAGTDPKCLEDWKNNLEQLYGNSKQYEQAAHTAEELAKRIPNATSCLYFVGHSLGGGLAANNALRTGCRAITFNPAALSAETLTHPERANLITSFIATNDILNWLQDTSQYADGMKQVIPATIGTRYYLYQPRVYPFASHTIAQMITNMESALSDDVQFDDIDD